jgi:hypothetical protein
MSADALAPLIGCCEGGDAADGFLRRDDGPVVALYIAGLRRAREA